MVNWYEAVIEEGIREEVKLLRDNGFNTECSCEHKRYVQCSYIPNGTIWELDKLLFNNGYRDYTILVTLERIDGHLRSFIDVNFREKPPFHAGAV